MKVTEALRYVLQDPARKTLPRIALEVIHSAVLEGEVPFYYFTSLLHQKESGDYRKFIGHRKISRISDEFFHTGGDHSLLENKLEFSQILFQAGIPTPKLLAHSENLDVNLANQSKTLKTERDLVEIIRQVVVWAGFSGPNDLSVCH